MPQKFDEFFHFFRILCTNEKTFKKAVDFLRIYKLYDNIRDKFFFDYSIMIKF